MDQHRMDQLIAKAAGIGLDDEESAELGRMYAELASKEYSSAAIQRAAHVGVGRPLSVREERRERRRRWPFSIFEKKVYTKARSLEIGQAATPSEDTDRAA